MRMAFLLSYIGLLVESKASTLRPDCCLTQRETYTEQLQGTAPRFTEPFSSWMQAGQKPFFTTLLARQMEHFPSRGSCAIQRATSMEQPKRAEHTTAVRFSSWT